MTISMVIFHHLSSIRSGGGSISDGFSFMSIFSVSVVDLLADLLGKSKFNSLASWSSELGNAFLGCFSGIFNFWDSDAFLFCEVLTADSWEGDWFVDTGLDWLRVGNLDSGLNWGNNRNVVASLLGDFLAVVVSVAVVSISWGGLADSDHLGVTFLVEGNLNSLGGGIFSLLLVRVGADLVIDFLNALSTDSASNIITLLFVYNDLDGKLNWIADSFESRGAYFSSFNNILN